jgi:hypothetical protein
MLEARLLTVSDGRYSVRTTSFAAIAAEMEKPVAPRKRKPSRRKSPADLVVSQE